jgi:hypothetical protein
MEWFGVQFITYWLLIQYKYEFILSKFTSTLSLQVTNKIYFVTTQLQF